MKIEKDKWKHFIVGLAMGVLFQCAGWYYLPAHHLLATLISFVIIVVISYGFELYSLFTGHGHYELWDAIAAVIGGILGMGAALLIIAL